MPRSLALIHTVTGVIPLFQRIVGSEMPDFVPFNIVDESLIRATIEERKLTPAIARRMIAYIWSAVDAGADGILVTCSSMGPAVDAAKAVCPIPLVRVDEGMAEEAVQTGVRLGIVATILTTLDPTREILSRQAQQAGRSIHIVDRLCEGAFDCFRTGDQQGHDRMIREAVLSLMHEVDAIVLAQASMTRALETIRPDRITVPILSSPESGVRRLKALMDRHFAVASPPKRTANTREREG